jgi:hypothetical protein
MILQGEPAVGTRATLWRNSSPLIQERAIYTDEHPNVMAVAIKPGGGIATGSAEEANGTSLDQPSTISARWTAIAPRLLVEQQIRELDTALPAIPAQRRRSSRRPAAGTILLERFVSIGEGPGSGPGREPSVPSRVPVSGRCSSVPSRP